MRPVVALATLILLASHPTMALAGNTPTELVAARELWEQAQEAQARHDWPACEKALASALPIVATPGIRFHLAYCREMQGKWVEALVEYKLVDEVIQSGTPAPDVEALLKPAIARLESRTPKLTLELSSPPDGLQFILDGKSVSAGLLNNRLSLNPGRHTVELKALGYLPLTRRLTLVEGEDRKLPLFLVPAQGETNTADAAPSKDAQASDDKPAATASLKPYLMIAEAALTLGAGSMALYYQLESDSVENDDPEVSRQARESASTKALVWGVGSGVGLVSFFATWLLWSDSPVAVSASGAGAHVLVSGKY